MAMTIGAKNMGIYKIASVKTGYLYIGSAINLSARKNKHLSALKNKKHHNIKLQNHVNKYGLDDLVFSVLEVVSDKTILLSKEQLYIDKLNPHFNICRIAGSRLGYKVPEKTREKLRGRVAWNKGQLTPDSVKEKMSLSQQGKRSGIKLSEQTKLKISKSVTGNKNASGKRTTEQKIKMSLSHFGKKLSKETREKMSSSRTGKIVSEQTRKKISIANSIPKPYRRGEKRSEETKSKIGLALGKKVVDSNTGIIYNKIGYAATAINLKRTTLNAMLSGQMKNKTNFEYLITTI